VLQSWTLQGEKKSAQQRTVTLLPNQVTELGNFDVAAEEPLVISARLLVDDKVVSRTALWPEPFKYLTLPNPDLTIEQDGEDLRLRVACPAKGVWLSAGDNIRWSDNFLDLLPDDEQVIVARGLSEGTVQARWLS
jgi:beta-mannosidase